MDTNELPDRDPLTGLLARGVWLRLIACAHGLLPWFSSISTTSAR